MLLLIIVTLGIISILLLLVDNRISSGIIFFSATILFLTCGIITPEEALNGFSNKGVLTVAVLFVISEGIKNSNVFDHLISHFLSSGKNSIRSVQMKVLPFIALISAFLNNTAVVMIAAPVVKRWSESMHIPASKFMIPVSFITIAGGLCTLIGTSTNLVVHSLMLESGIAGFSLFELGKVGIFCALATFFYLYFLSPHILPGNNTFINKQDQITGEKKLFRNRRKEITAIILLLFMVIGAGFSEAIELPVKNKPDMFIFASLTMICMFITGLIPARQYTKYIHWDILITIACAFAISKAIGNSGIADIISGFILNLTSDCHPVLILAVIYLITNLFTQIVPNNAAAAMTFPIALATAARMGIDPKPFCVAICIAASASFIIPHSYQTNLIAMHLGDHNLKNFVRAGLPLSIILFILSVTLIPVFFSF